MRVYNFEYDDYNYYDVDKQKLYDKVYDLCINGKIDSYNVFRDFLYTDYLDDYDNTYDNTCEMFFNEHTIVMDYEEYLSEFFSFCDVIEDDIISKDILVQENVKDLFCFLNHVYDFSYNIKFEAILILEFYKDISVKINISNNQVLIFHKDVEEPKSWIVCLAKRIEDFVKKNDVKVVIL